MNRILLLAAAGGCMLAAGCGEEGRIRPETIEVKEDTPLKRATTLLQSYAKGQALGSEVESFPSLVGDLRAIDAQRADVLEKGLEELKKTKGSATAAKAKEILARLAPKQTG